MPWLTNIDVRSDSPTISGTGTRTQNASNSGACHRSLTPVAIGNPESWARVRSMHPTAVREARPLAERGDLGSIGQSSSEPNRQQKQKILLHDVAHAARVDHLVF